MIGRRRFLGLAAAVVGQSALGLGSVFAAGERTRIQLARLRLPGQKGDPRPGALERLAFEVTLRTSTSMSFKVAQPALGDEALFHTPFLYLWGDVAFAPWSEGERRRLRRHLEFGGTLLADDGSGQPRSGFSDSLEREAKALFPEAPLKRLPDEHSVFRSFYLVRSLGGRRIVSPFLEGVTLDDRSPLLLCRNDLGGAWARDAGGDWLHECVPGGENQRQSALALGVNVVLYALTVNYKQDAIHLPFILQRMRR